MTENDFREEAEQHWLFLKKVFDASNFDMTAELLHTLYVEAMVHGYKHAVEEMKE